MIELQELMKLPKAGQAVFNVHRWLAKQPAMRVSALDVMDVLARAQMAVEERWEVVNLLAAGGGEAEAAAALLHSLMQIDRVEAVALCNGIDPSTLRVDPELAAKLRRLLGGTDDKAGARDA